MNWIQYERGRYWLYDGVNPPVKSKEQPTPYHNLGRK